MFAEPRATAEKQKQEQLSSPVPAVLGRWPWVVARARESGKLRTRARASSRQKVLCARSRALDPAPARRRPVPKHHSQVVLPLLLYQGRTEEHKAASLGDGT